MKDFVKNIVQHLNSLLEYLQSVKKERFLKENYSHIVKTPLFHSFIDAMTTTKGTTLVAAKVNELTASTFVKLDSSNDDLLDNVIGLVQQKIKDVRDIDFTIAH